METLTEETSVTSAASVGQQVLSLAEDALCFAATALRLTLMAPSGCGDREHDVELREISLAEVAYHDDPKDCWIVVHDLVYDITSFLHDHPGGADVMLEYAGRDASLAFRSVNHGPEATRALEDLLIGRLPQQERIFGRASDTFSQKKI